jgi:hypothetical protein
MLYMCKDCHAVNTITVKDCYPLPYIEDLLNRMHGSCSFTQLDLVAWSQQICITTTDRQKMAFTTKFGLCEWRVPPFGLANAPSQFMDMMNCILEQMICKFIILYHYDIKIYSHTLAEYVVHVHEVHTLLMRNGLKAKLVKCACACQKVHFCCSDIDRGSIYAQEHKTRMVMDWPPPEKIKNVRVSLGLTSYYRKLIEHYFHTAIRFNFIGTPLKREGDVEWRCEELRNFKRTPFAWERECWPYFDLLQNAHSITLVMAVPDPEAEYCLHVDACQHALGAGLSQIEDKPKKVLGNYSL